MGKKADLTELVCIMDRSGSMGAIRSDAIGGFNTFLEEQKKVEGKANLTLVMFDTKHDVIHDGVDVQEVKSLDETTYIPGGATALLDAIGKTIGDVARRHAELKKSKRPKNVLVAILTDGQENSSKEFCNPERIKILMDEKRKDKWQFVFLSSDMSAIETARSIGIRDTDSALIGSSGGSYRSAYSAVNAMATSMRCSTSDEPVTLDKSKLTEDA